MKTHQKQRDLLRNKRKINQQKTIIKTILITFGVLTLFIIATFMPKILSKQDEYNSGQQGFYIGDPASPISVVAFSNYSCGYCKLYSESIEKDLITDFVEKGYVYYRYVNIPYNSEQSHQAAEASYCAAEQNRFFAYKALLYTNASASDGFSSENLVKYADLVGLDVDKFRVCMESDAYALAYYEDIIYAQSQNVNATPTFLVNGNLTTANDLISTIENLLRN